MSAARGINTYANRGRPFEELLKVAHLRYQAEGVACVHKVPTEFIPIRDGHGKIVSCKVEEKSCVDYLGRYRNIPVAVEAKHTDGSRIEFSEVQPHQAEYMDAFCKAPGAVGLIVVSFGLRRFFAVPWPFWKEAREVWRIGHQRGASAPVKAYGMFWDTPGMASASPEQLHPEWEIRQGGKYILPYLHIIEHIVRRQADYGK